MQRRALERGPVRGGGVRDGVEEEERGICLDGGEGLEGGGRGYKLQAAPRAHAFPAAVRAHRGQYNMIKINIKDNMMYNFSVDDIT